MGSEIGEAIWDRDVTLWLSEDVLQAYFQDKSTLIEGGWLVTPPAPWLEPRTMRSLWFTSPL